jgi:hypothetical protein
MTGGMKHVKRPLQRKILPERNVLKTNQSKSEQYKQARKETNKVCKEKKKQRLNNRINQIDDAHKQNETRKFLKGIRNFQNDRSPPIFICKDENGTFTDKQEVLDRWKQYFADLMKTDKETIDQTQERNIIENETEIEQPTYKEVSDIRNNKTKRE